MLRNTRQDDAFYMFLRACIKIHSYLLMQICIFQRNPNQDVIKITNEIYASTEESTGTTSLPVSAIHLIAFR